MKKYKDIILWTVLILLILIVLLIKVKPEVGNLVRAEKSIKEKTVQLADLQRQLDTLKQNAANADAEKTQGPKQVKNIYKPETASSEVDSGSIDDIITNASTGPKVYNPEIS